MDQRHAEGWQMSEYIKIYRKHNQHTVSPLLYLALSCLKYVAYTDRMKQGHLYNR